jgi:broad specificity phosphatase PhoE
MITLIRHAESTYNSSGDRTRDCPLSGRGHRQAARISGNYDVIVCSSMKRSRQTLTSSKLAYREVIFTNLCREIIDKNPINSYPKEKISAETRKHIRARVAEFKSMIRNLAKSHSRIAVISHSGFLYELTGDNFDNADQRQYNL